jgi:hypothetical protein
VRLSQKTPAGDYRFFFFFCQEGVNKKFMNFFPVQAMSDTPSQDGDKNRYLAAAALKIWLYHCLDARNYSNYPVTEQV